MVSSSILPVDACGCIRAASIFVSFTTLFTIAEQQFGDPLRWTDIAELNGLTDPWVFSTTQILLPPVLSTATPDGILGKPTSTPLAVVPPPVITYPIIPNPPATPYLNSNGTLALDPHGQQVVH